MKKETFPTEELRNELLLLFKSALLE